MSAPARIEVNWAAHLEALPLPTWIVDFDAEPSLSQGQYLSARDQCGPVFANRACRDILGISAEQIDGKTVLRYVHPEDRASCLAAWDRFLSGQAARFHRQFRWIRPDTKETVNLVVRAQRLLCGDIQGWLRSAAAEDALSRLGRLAHARS